MYAVWCQGLLAFLVLLASPIARCCSLLFGFHARLLLHLCCCYGRQLCLAALLGTSDASASTPVAYALCRSALSGALCAMARPPLMYFCILGHFLL